MLLDTYTHFQDIVDEKFVLSLFKQLTTCETTKIYCHSVSPEDWSLVNIITRQTENIIPFYGVHPWYADRVKADWDTLLERTIIKQMEAGIGEIGLDKASKNSDYEKQKEVFTRQVKSAIKFNKPMAIRCVQAWEDLYAILNEHKHRQMRFMVLAYDGPSSMLKKLVELGGFISFSHKQLASGNDFINNLLADTPIDRLLLGTDYPYVENRKAEPNPAVERFFTRLRDTYAMAFKIKEDEDESDLKKQMWDNGVFYITGDKNPKDKQTKFRD